MPRKKGGVEIGIAVGLLAAVAGCATVVVKPDPQPPAYAIDTPPPENLDYLGALRCGGLSWALQAVRHDDQIYSEHFAGQTGLFIKWAETLARDVGQDFTAAKGDMAMIRDGILATASGITADRRSESISRRYRSEQRACDAMAYDPAHAFVVIGG